MNTTTGLSLKEQGLALIEAHAGDFVTVMRELAHRIDRLRGMVSTDDLRPLAKAIGLEPVHCNAWGSVFHERGWQIIGRKRSVIPSCHYREIKVWTYRPGGVL